MHKEALFSVLFEVDIRREPESSAPFTPEALVKTVATRPTVKAFHAVRCQLTRESLHTFLLVKPQTCIEQSLEATRNYQSPA